MNSASQQDEGRMQPPAITAYDHWRTHKLGLSERQAGPASYCFNPSTSSLLRQVRDRLFHVFRGHVRMARAPMLNGMF